MPAFAGRTTVQKLNRIENAADDTCGPLSKGRASFRLVAAILYVNNKVSMANSQIMRRLESDRVLDNVFATGWI